MPDPTSDATPDATQTHDVQLFQIDDLVKIVGHKEVDIIGLRLINTRQAARINDLEAALSDMREALLKGADRIDELEAQLKNKG